MLRLAVALLAFWSVAAMAEPLRVVASINVYADIARQLALPDAEVSAILNNPDADPHAFEPGPAVARALALAHVVVQNGMGYDPWMAKLLRASRAPQRHEVVVAEALRRPADANPHVWYDPAAAPIAAAAISAALARADPANAPEYDRRLQAFVALLQPLNDAVADLRRRFAAVPVTATEPVFGPMAAAVGLAMRNERFQLAVMHETEPRPSDVAAFEGDLRSHRVRALIYNRQAGGPLAQRMLRLAQASGVPIVGVTETKPDGVSFQAWMLEQLLRLDRALATP